MFKYVVRYRKGKKIFEEIVETDIPFDYFSKHDAVKLTGALMDTVGVVYRYTEKEATCSIK